MIPFKKEKGILAAAIGIFSSAVLAPTAESVGEGSASHVDLPNYSHGTGPCDNVAPVGNCYAAAYNYGIIVDGGFARFDVRNVTTPDFQIGGHTNHALWVGVNSGAEFCEVGWSKGWNGDGNYVHYVAWRLNGNYDESPLYFPVGSHGTVHAYQISRYNATTYKAYIDNTEVYTYNHNAGPWTLNMTTGLEYSDPYATAETNDPRDLQWRNPSDLSWHFWSEAPSDIGTIVRSSPGYPVAYWLWQSYPNHGRDGIN